MSGQKQFVKESWVYFVGHVLGMVSGLISAPVMTRMLTKRDYGTMVLINSTISLIGLVAGLGIQDAVMRFYSTYAANPKTVGQIGHFRNTALSFSFCISGVAVLLLILGSYAAGFFIELGPFVLYLRVASILILLRAVTDIYLSFYRAEGRPGYYSAVMLSQQYLVLFFSITFLLYLFSGLWGVYIGTLLGEGIVTVLFLVLLFRERKVEKPEWERSTVRTLVQYGTPLLLGNISLFILNLGDRYVIRYYLNMEEVANYSVPYQLSVITMTAVLAPVRTAFYPFIFSLYEKNGGEAAGRIIAWAMRYMFIVMIPVIFGISYLGEDIILVFATAKYAPFARLLPWLLVGLSAYGMYHAIISSVLLIFKKTGLISLLTCCWGGVNILLNIVLVPYWGLWGAAIATAVTYILLCLSAFLISRSYIKIAMDFMAVLKAVMFSVVMLGVLVAMGDSSQYVLLKILEKSLMGMLVYFLLLFVFDDDCRGIFYLFFKKARALGSV